MLTCLNISAQIKVGDNVSTVDGAAAIEIESTSKGILFPRMTTTQMSAISSPPHGLVIFNTTEGCLYYFNNATWLSVKSGITAMSDGDDDTKIQLEETYDEDKIRFDVNGNQAMIIDDAGKVGIGVDSPTVVLHVDANYDSLQIENLSGTGDGIGISSNGKIYRTTFVPVGSLQLYGGSSTPTGWLSCDGSEVSRTDYADLFTAIGTTYGVGDGSTTFELPDLRGSVPVGYGTGSGLSNRSMGDVGGEESHVLTTDEIPSHSHTMQVNSSDGTSDVPTNLYIAKNSDGVTHYHGSGSGDYLNSGAITATGGGSSHNNMPPFVVINYIIKY